MMNEMEIAGRKIGENHPPYIIAEVSANHNGSIDKALKLITIAKESGADAVKIQTYTADTMTIKCEKPEFKIQGGLWDGEYLYDLYEKAHTPWDWHKRMFDHAKEVGITIFSSPFDESAVDFLEELGAPAYKVASFELLDIPLIKKMASTGKPIIMSSGMANLDEIKEAYEAVRSTGNDQVCVLHCVSGYPTPAKDSNLKTITHLKNEFGSLVGLSDHTLTTSTAVTSIALGACVIEKHFIEDRNDKGPDSDFSLEPSELKTLCEDTKTAWEAIGDINYEKKSSEKANSIFRRSIYFVEDIKKGEKIDRKNTRRIRPGFGLEPKYHDDIIGKIAKTDISRGTPVSWDLIE